MNWYRVKVELAAWAARTSLCVLGSLIALRTLFQPEGSIKFYGLSFRMLAEHEWVIRLGFWLGLMVMVVCYWRVVREYRSRRAYGER